jgi:hypothetical protein
LVAHKRGPRVSGIHESKALLSNAMSMRRAGLADGLRLSLAWSAEEME